MLARNPDSKINLPAVEALEKSLARLKPKTLILAEQRLTAAREARAKLADRRGAAYNESFKLVQEQNFGSEPRVAKLLEEASDLDKQIADCEPKIGITFTALEIERERYLSTFFRALAKKNTALAPMLDSALATLREVDALLAVGESAAVNCGFAAACVTGVNDPKERVWRTRVIGRFANLAEFLSKGGNG